MAINHRYRDALLAKGGPVSGNESENQQKYQHLDIQQTYFVWSKSSKDYYWYDRAEFRALYAYDEVDFKVRGPFLLEKDETASRQYIKILEEYPKLFLEFIKTPVTREGILKFANSYGMLTTGEVGEITKGDSTYSSRGESLDFWQKEIRELGWIFKTWEWLEEKDEQALDSVFDFSDESIDYFLSDNEVMEQFSNAGEALEMIRTNKKQTFCWSAGALVSKAYQSIIYKRLEDGGSLLTAKFLIKTLINRHLEDYPIIPTLMLHKQDQWVSYLKPTGLLGAMWLQFFQTVIGERKLQKCAVCDLYEDVTDRTSRWTMHPGCSRRKRSKIYRDKEKEKQKESAKKPAKKKTTRKPAKKATKKRGK